MRLFRAILLLLALGATSAPAQYCATAKLLELFGKGLTIEGTVNAANASRKLLYTESDGSPAFGPMDQECGAETVANNASAELICQNLKPNTVYYIHPSYDSSTHRDCQPETAAFDCGAVAGFPGTAGEAACEVETDADGTNEVVKIRTPDDGDAVESPDPPVHSRAWDAGYAGVTITSTSTVSTATVDGKQVATNFQALANAAVDLLKANPTNTYRVSIPAGTRLRPNQEAGSPTLEGFVIPPCVGTETGGIIWESSTPDPDAMPPLGAPPAGDEEWAFFEFNPDTPLTFGKPALLDFEEPACPTYVRGVTLRAPPHAEKDRIVVTGTATVTPGGGPYQDVTELDFADGALDGWPDAGTFFLAGITVDGLKADIFQNGSNIHTAPSGRTIVSRTNPTGADRITLNGFAASTGFGTPGAAKLHNIFSLPFTSAAGNVLTTPPHPYVDPPTTNISSIVSGVVTTAEPHGLGIFGQGNPVWVSGSDNGAGGDCDGFYANASPGGVNTNNYGRDTTTLTLLDEDGAAIADCNTANGTVRFAATILAVNDDGSAELGCYVSFPSSTQVRLELCTPDGGQTTFVPDFTGDTGWVSYDPPFIPPFIEHNGGPVTFSNVTFQARRPYRIGNVATSVNSADGGLYIVGYNADVEMWHPVSPNARAGGALSASKVGGFDLSVFVRLLGDGTRAGGDHRQGPGWLKSPGFAIFGAESYTFSNSVQDITKFQVVHTFAEDCLGGLSGVICPFRQADEYKAGVDRLAWRGNQFIGFPEHNVPAPFLLYCKKNSAGYSAELGYQSCSNIDIRYNFLSSGKILQSGVSERANNSSNTRLKADRKVSITDNILRPWARTSPIGGESLTLGDYTGTKGFFTIDFTFSRTGDLRLSNNLRLPNLGDSATGPGDAMSMLVDAGVNMGGGVEIENNLALDSVSAVLTYNRFGGTWANEVEAKYLTDGAFDANLTQINTNAVAYCNADLADGDYTALQADVCANGDSHWNAAGYAAAFARATCNINESCATRAGRLIDTATLEPQPAYSAYGPQPSVAAAIDEMGVVGPVTGTERLTDGSKARFTVHTPDAAKACVVQYAAAGAAMGGMASGVGSLALPAGQQSRQALIEGLPAGAHQYRVRCEYTQGMARGVF